MVKIYKQPFAHDGDTIAIPDASQPDGKISNSDGWTPDYQLPKTDPNYKPVGRQEMNGVFKEVTEALGQVQVQGAASWSADGAPYPSNAQVYHNGKQWLALRANSVAPAEGDDWRQAFVIPTGQNIVVFDTAGVTNWTVPAVLQSGLLKAHVTVVGGGGGSWYQRGGGGAAGGSSFSVLDLTGTASVSITVGAGGAGSGGSSSFGAFCSATGGGSGAGIAGGYGGVGSGGAINNGGSDGSDGLVAGGSGDGGASIFSGAGRSSSNEGRSATGYGSGAGSGESGGGSGASGVVIIQW